MSTQRYYDEFSRGYDRHRGRGYHRLLDRAELDIVSPWVADREVLDLACGTGLILMALHERARHAVGVDLSAGMLGAARRRGLRVVQGAADSLPFPDARFDVVTCFKAFPHFPRPGPCLAEIRRVLRPGGVAAVELYNPRSLRGLLRRYGPRRATSARFHEGQVETRFDSAETLPLPTGLELLTTYGIRVVTPAGGLLDVPGVGGALARLERALTLRRVFPRWAGFLVVLLKRTEAS